MSNAITADNFNLVAAKAYDDLGATEQDFKEDLRRFLLLKRLFNQYKKTKELKERLILNHIIIILNVFGDKAVDLLFFSLKDHLSQLVVFLVLLDRLPKQSGSIICSTINLDEFVIRCLRQTIKV